MKKNAKYFAWCYLTKFGFVDSKWNTFSGYNKDDKCYKRTFDALKGILDVGVDWNKTKEPTDIYNSVFVGTFDENDRSYALEGTLVLKNGKKYHFEAKMDEAMYIFELMELMQELTDIENIADMRGVEEIWDKL